MRKYDGLAETESTDPRLREYDVYEGLEVKSGSAEEKYHNPRTGWKSDQAAFDAEVSESNPAFGRLNGRPIAVTKVHLIVRE